LPVLSVVKGMSAMLSLVSCVAYVVTTRGFLLPSAEKAPHRQEGPLLSSSSLRSSSSSRRMSPQRTTPTTRYAAAKRRHPTSSSKSTNNAMISEPCNVVLTTTNCDFDSLAAACALARLWSKTPGKSEVPTHVVLPRGAMPSVARFLTYHKHVLPVRGFKTIDADDIRAVGVVDASSAARLGRATPWLEKAESVHVFDHHLGVQNGSLASVADEFHVEAVGSTTTMIVERLRDAKVEPDQAEATLYVLGIRADTGGLAYESTTLRDAEALCWLLAKDASQAAVAEFSLERVSTEQRQALAEALPRLKTVTCRGVSVASVAVSTPRYVPGLAGIADELLSLAAADVLIMACTTSQGNKRWVDLIGRARPKAGQSVDLRAVMHHFGGGGHQRAAAAALSLDLEPQEPQDPQEPQEPQEPQDQGALAAANEVLEQVKEILFEQIPPELTAGDLMTPGDAPGIRIDADSTVDEAKDVLLSYGGTSLFVVDKLGELRGQIKLNDIVKTQKKHNPKAEPRRVKGHMRSELTRVRPTDTIAYLEHLLQTHVGRIPVVDEDNVFLGVVTRLDVLNAHRLYDRLQVANQRSDLPSRRAEDHDDLPEDHDDDVLFEEKAAPPAAAPAEIRLLD